MADLTPKQEMFCQEYLIDLNGTQAAIRAGYGFNEQPPKHGFYTYCLISSTDNKVFYVGKGKGDRVFHHEKRIKTNRTNKNKLNAISECLNSGGKILHLILSIHDLENDSLSVESKVIDFIGHDKLTNIAKTGYKSKSPEYDLPSIYSFKTVGEWAKRCLSVIDQKGGKIYFLGVHSQEIQDIVLNILNKNIDNGQVV